MGLQGFVRANHPTRQKFMENAESAVRRITDFAYEGSRLLLVFVIYRLENDLPLPPLNQSNLRKFFAAIQRRVSNFPLIRKPCAGGGLQIQATDGFPHKRNL
jgi:hypothetical protein